MRPALQTNKIDGDGEFVQYFVQDVRTPTYCRMLQYKIRRIVVDYNLLSFVGPHTTSSQQPNSITLSTTCPCLSFVLEYIVIAAMGSNKKKSKKGSRKEKRLESSIGSDEEGTTQNVTDLAPTTTLDTTVQPAGRTSPSSDDGLSTKDSSPHVAEIEADGKTKKKKKRGQISDELSSAKRTKPSGEEEADDSNNNDANDDKPNFYSQEMFESLPLSDKTAAALRELQFTRMTQIQEKAIPALLTGKDLIGAAKTGSGKTLVRGRCFLLDSVLFVYFLCS